jgi:uncharacterized protein YdhG (YjbR/CyaY superfamily)
VNKVADRSTANTIDEYIARFPPEIHQVLEAVRELIRASAPGAIKTISYAIPMFNLHGKHLMHFAGYARHIGFYPKGSGIEAFAQELKPNKRGKGSAQFSLDRPLPTNPIGGIVEFKVEKIIGKG